jgi:stage V sporulation protein G
MEITEVRVFPVNEEKLKAYATITFDDCFVVRDLKVIHGNSGLFVAMPSKKRKDGTFKDVAHPLNNEFRSKIEQKVLDAYEAERAAAAGAHPKSGSPAPGSAAEGGSVPQG